MAVLKCITSIVKTHWHSVVSNNVNLAINTHNGVYAYQRLKFGIATAPSIFQAAMDQILQGMANVVCYLDDILIASTTEEEHLTTLDEVLSRSEKYGVVVNQSKYEFRTSSVEYMGHRIDEDGLNPLKDKIAAIVDAPSPTNVSEDRAYLDLINYYATCMSNRATVLKPLHNPLRAGEKWVWSGECESVFQERKLNFSLTESWCTTIPKELWSLIVMHRSTE